MTETTTPATETRTTCPLHNIRDCATCYTEPGECEFGGRSCGRPATHQLQHPREVRGFCKEHATSPVYAFARIGYVVETL